VNHRTWTAVVASIGVLISTAVVGTGTAYPASRPAGTNPLSTPWSLNTYGPGANDDAVLRWNEQVLATIRANPAQTGPTVAARALGVVQTAVYDAWAAYDPVAKGTRLGSKLRRPAAERTAANKSKAISFAAYKALNDLFPDATFHRKNLYDGLMSQLGYDPADTSTPATVGNTAAQAVLDYRHGDGANQLGGYADTTGYQAKNTWDTISYPWHWQPLCVLTAAGVAANKPAVPTSADGCPAPYYVIQKPLTPQWGRVLPFTPNLLANVWLPGPPKNADGTYSTADIDTALQDTAYLDDPKKAKAEYWADGPASEFPPGHAAVFAQALCRRLAMSLDSEVKFFFMVGNAMMDASIAAWSQKYVYDFVRPVTAIRARGTTPVVSWLGPNQGYGTVPASQWRPYQAVTVLTPAFPEYVSGHSAFSGATAAILAAFLGGDTFNGTWTVKAGSSKIEQGVPAQDVVLSWPTFSDAANEAGWSRRWGGIHFQSGDYDGRGLGRQVAQYAYGTASNYINGLVPG
jgi:hypothetical protein